MQSGAEGWYPQLLPATSTGCCPARACGLLRVNLFLHILSSSLGHIPSSRMTQPSFCNLLPPLTPAWCPLLSCHSPPNMGSFSLYHNHSNHTADLKADSLMQQRETSTSWCWQLHQLHAGWCLVWGHWVPRGGRAQQTEETWCCGVGGAGHGGAGP